MASYLALQRAFNRRPQMQLVKPLRLPIKLPAQRWPRAQRRAYQAAIFALLARVEAEVREQLYPLLDRILEQHARERPDGGGERIDMTGTLTDDALDRIEEGLSKGDLGDARIRMLAQEHAVRVSAFNKAEVANQLGRIIPIDLHASEAGLSKQIDAFVSDNVRLIKSVSFTQLDEMKGIVLGGARKGLRVEEIQNQIEARFGLSRSRASLIARDQIGKLNGELTQLRQQALGVRRYRWSTSKDERVRHKHRQLDGTVQEWRKAPVVDEKRGRQEHPGGDYQCRCNAIPIVEDVLQDWGVLEPAAAQASVQAQARPAFVPKPAVPEPDAVYRQLQGPLEIKSSVPTGEGVNASEFLTLEAPDGAKVKGIWKNSANDSRGLRPGIAAGTYAEREAAAYQLDQMLGGETIVPPTVARDLVDARGRKMRGSLQAFVGGAKSIDDVYSDITAISPSVMAREPSLRRMFLLDVITANDDRHGGNVLWRRLGTGRMGVVAIDNGLTFPERGPSRFIFALYAHDFQVAMLSLDRESRRMLRRLDLASVAKMLRGHRGITTRQIRETLARIRAMQKNPNVLRKEYDSSGGLVPPDDTVEGWLSRSPEETLSKQELRKIDRLLGDQ